MSRKDVKDQAATLDRPGATVRCVDESARSAHLLQDFWLPT